MDELFRASERERTRPPRPDLIFLKGDRSLYCSLYALARKKLSSNPLSDNPCDLRTASSPTVRVMLLSYLKSSWVIWPGRDETVGRQGCAVNPKDRVIQSSRPAFASLLGETILNLYVSHLTPTPLHAPFVQKDTPHVAGTIYQEKSFYAE